MLLRVRMLPDSTVKLCSKTCRFLPAQLKGFTDGDKQNVLQLVTTVSSRVPDKGSPKVPNRATQKVMQKEAHTVTEKVTHALTQRVSHMQ